MKQSNHHKACERAKIGKLSGIVGIVCNTILSIGKIAVGNFSSSMSIMADGLNNLSDAASSIVTLLGFKLAEKPADKKHPYGHARFEYLASLTVSMLILVIGFELAISSIKKIIQPTPIEFSPVVICVLISSIFLKLFMMFYNQRIGKKIQSKTLLATAADSRNDAIMTSAVVIASVTEHFTDLKIDGIIGLFVSVFILCSGIFLAKETISPLLGEGVDFELRKQIINYIESFPMVIGCHDLMVHDYGHGERYASIHVEMDRGVDALVCHEMIDKIERECLSWFGIHLVIHYDPVLINDPQTERLKNFVITILKIKDERLEIHDFRVLTNNEFTELVFDVIVPEDLQCQKGNIQTILEQALKQFDTTSYTLNITFDLE